MGTKLIFGCGYLGERVARLWQARGHAVHAVTRSDARAAQFRAAGWQAILGDLTREHGLPPLPVADTVLFAVGHDAASHADIHTVFVEGLARATAALAHPPSRFIYISSVGVYGQTDGAWLDENSPCLPTRPGGRACVEAERQLQTGPLASRSIILRAGGIYGPGRIPRRADILAGKPIAAASEGYLNLIHVDDLAAAVLAAENLEPPRLYCVTDGRPPVRGDYYAELARLLHAPAPRFERPSPESHNAGRSAANKRVRSERFLRDTGMPLQYPDYRAGLAAIVAAETETDVESKSQ